MNRRRFTLGTAALLTGGFDVLAETRRAGEISVLYAGATGSVGRIAIELLRDQGFAVRAITRNPVRAAKAYGDEYQWVFGDVRDPEQMARLAQGADYIVCSVSYTEFEGPNSPQFVDYMGVRNLADAAHANAVRQLVVVSAGGAGPLRDHRQNPRFGYVAYWKTKGEDYLKKSGVPFTIVGPTGFVDGPGGVTGVRLAPRSEYHMGTITRADVALVTSGCVGNQDAFGKSFFIENDTAIPPGAWRQVLRGIASE